MKRTLLIAFAAATVLLASSCDWDDKVSEPFRDAPRSPDTNSGPAAVVEMPNGFSNVATKCDHGNRIYIAYHGDSPYAAIAVVPNDGSCK